MPQRIEVQVSGRTADQWHAVQFHAEHRREALLAARFRVHQQKRKAVLERTARTAREFEPQLMHARSEVRKSDVGYVLEHGIRRSETAGRKMKSGDTAGIEAIRAEAAAGGGADHSLDPARREFSSECGKVMHSGRKDDRQSAVAASGADGGSGGGHGAAGQLETSDGRRRLPHDSAAPVRPPPVCRNSIKSSSQYSLIRRTASTARSDSVCRSSTRRIFPEMVFGKFANSRRRMRLNGDTRPRTCSRMERAVAASAVAPAANTT